MAEILGSGKWQRDMTVGDEKAKLGEIVVEVVQEMLTQGFWGRWL